MDAYSEFIEPSRINHSLSCRFTSQNEENLIVAKATILQIFEIVHLKLNSSEKASYKLKLVQQYKLQGLITDIKSIRTKQNPLIDYLLVSTETAKLSLIKWDFLSNSISTVSLHFYESALENLSYEKLTESDLIVDPNGLCACLRFRSSLAFLPFHKHSEEEENDANDHDFTNKKNTEMNSNVFLQGSEEELFEPSFIIDAKSLDSRLGDIIDIQFLYNYSDPTLAVLTSTQETWAGLLPKSKDTVSYIVLSLDLATKTSTTVLKIDGLPYDIDKVLPLPNPLSGSLLLGCNGLVHVDSGGVVKKVSVNPFLSSITNSARSFYDQSALNLKLENCAVKSIPGESKVILILKDGEIYFINFDIDGKRIKNMYLEKLDSPHDDYSISYPNDIICLPNNLIFLSNKNSDAFLLETVFESNEEKDNKETDSIPKIAEDEDDLYQEDDEKDHSSSFKRIKGYEVKDVLLNNGPISSFTFGKFTKDKFKSNLANPNYGELCLVTNCGSGNASKLNIFTPTINPIIRSSLSFSQINRMWIVGKEFLITSDDLNSKSEIFQINKSFARLNSKHFTNDEMTIGVHEITSTGHILQVTPKNIIVYNKKFKKTISFSKELKNFKNDEIIQSTFNDEFLMVFFSSGEVRIYSINTYNETFSKIAIPKILNDTIITTGYITNSRVLNAISKNLNLAVEATKGTKRKLDGNSRANSSDESVASSPKQKVFVLVTGDNRIVLFNRFHNEKCFQLNDVEKFSDYLSLVFFEPRDTYPDPYIKNIVLNELGDINFKEEYLTILTMGGEILLYKLYFDGTNFKFMKEKDLPLTGASYNAYPSGTSIERRLVYFPDLNGYTGLFVTGSTPYFISKTIHSIPRIFKFTKIPAVSFSPYSDSNVRNGFIFLDNSKNARICELPTDFNYEFNWPVKKILISETVKSVAYHELSHTYAISTYGSIPYECLDEEGKPIVGVDNSKPSAFSYKGSLRLISPYNWSIIETIEMQDNEIGMNVKSLLLDVGSATKRFKNKKELIVLGGGKYRMEDLGANGSFKIFEIIDIIPEPGRPETNHKFKEVHQEDTKGAVTSICEVSGRLLVAQGQKIIVRDLQDDGVVPVAFLDTSVYVSEAKSFRNLVVLGDSLKSIWLAGFDAEPFRMILLSKDLQSRDVNCADFLVKDEELYILVGDNNNVIHVLKYDPEDIQSSNGQRLVCKSSFRINYSPSCFASIPKFEEFGNTDASSFQTVGSTIDGCMFVVFPVNEATYRRMYILQQQMTDKEYHACGLNPRLNRIGGLDYNYADVNSKPILDCELLKTFSSLKDDRKRALSLKISSKNILQEISKDLIEFQNVLANL